METITPHSEPTTLKKGFSAERSNSMVNHELFIKILKKITITTKKLCNQIPNTFYSLFTSSKKKSVKFFYFFEGPTLIFKIFVIFKPPNKKTDRCFSRIIYNKWFNDFNILLKYD